MKPIFPRIVFFSLLALGLLPGCPDDGVEEIVLDMGADRFTGDVRKKNIPANYKPYPCKEPGRSCNAHDLCAINSICGKDYKCWPEFLMDCDDELSCTVDSCKGQGLCDNQPKSGYCALGYTVAPTDAGWGDAWNELGTTGGKSVFKCFKKGDRNPNDQCLICNPDSTDGGSGMTGKVWSPASDGTCNDGVSCTKDDKCVSGICKGTNYLTQCADSYSCTEDLCDGKGACLGSKLKSGWCLISAVCYKEGTKHPSGTCYKCETAKSTSAWTPITESCYIDSKCYAKGEKHSLGCAECDPVTSTSAWTVKGSYCLINNVCKNPNDKDSIACSECDPTKDKYGWTALSGLCKISGSCFKNGDLHDQGCAKCDTTTSSTSWTVSGNYCLVNNACKNPAEKDKSGCGTCDPTKDKYGWTALSGMCKIDGGCHSNGTLHTGGCAECDTTVSTTSWALTGSGCLIDLKCYASAAQHPAGCASCDTSKSTSSWTVTGTSCAIGKQCLSSGTKEVGGCATCDPTKSQTSWTKPTGCYIAHDWSQEFGALSSDYGYGIAADGNSNVYITGYYNTDINFGGGTMLTSMGGSDIYLASFSPSGAYRWSKSFGGSSSDYGYAVAVDGDDNVYITGSFYNTINFGGSSLTSKGSNDIFVASFDTNGTHRWSKGFGYTSSDYGKAIATDHNGNVYATGYFYSYVDFGSGSLTSKGGNDIFVASFDTNGTHRWSKNFGYTSTDYGYGIAVDGSGNPYVTGAFYSYVDFGGGSLTSVGSYDIFVASFDPSGAHRWSKGFGSSSSDYGYDIAVDSSANVYVTGYFYYSVDFGGGSLTSKGGNDIFVASYTPAGSHRWSKSFGNTSSDYGYGVAADSSGNAYVTGAYYNSVDFGGGSLSSKGSNDIFVASFDTNGTHRFSRGHGSSSSDYGYDIAVDSSANAYVTGYFYSAVDFGGGSLTSAGSTDIFLLRLSP